MVYTLVRFAVIAWQVKFSSVQAWRKFSSFFFLCSTTRFICVFIFLPNICALVVSSARSFKISQSFRLFTGFLKIRRFCVHCVCSILQRFLWRRSFQSILPWMKPLLWTRLPFVGVSFVLRLLTFFGVQQTVHIFFSLSTAQKISMDVDWVMLQVGLNFLCRKCRMFRSVFQRGSCHDEFRIPRYLLTFGFSFLNSFVGGKQCISRHSLQLLAWNQQDAHFLFWNSET